MAKYIFIKANIAFLLLNIFFFRITYNTFQAVKTLRNEKAMLQLDIQGLELKQKNWIKQNAPLIDINNINI